MTCSHYENVPGFPGCCQSCHEDADQFDYGMCEDPNDPDGDEVCCAVSRWLKAIRYPASKEQGDKLDGTAEGKG